MKSENPERPAVLVMARYWGMGPVKTRLAADLGQEQAREVYRYMVEALWTRLEDSRLLRHLWVSEAAHLDACRTWLPGADRIRVQAEGDLGERMLRAFRAAQDLPWCAVIGTDCPALDAQAILAAGSALEHADLSIAPTFDGGYALLASREPIPGLFEDIPWSTSEVLEATLQRAEHLGLKVALGETRRDLDDLADLRRLQAEGLLP
ncbi:MAG: TIGR04282 family arsenosugar biosynthesis glycosyltransferase [Planctomycetota bacterium]|jgi:rSAM/selenodomain-associated transferase 1